ncbi:MAG: GNAT family N-acetyltransferase [Gemmatimonadota bacterium]
MRPAYRPVAGRGGAETGLFCLRDGGRARLFRVLPEDADRVASFLDRLAKAEREEVVRSLGLEEGEVSAFLGSLSDAAVGEAFFVEADGEVERIGAFGAYRVRPAEDTASLSLAVAPSLRRRGLAGLLLERLAVRAARRGLERLVGRARSGNEGAARLFRHSGFETEERRRGRFVSFVLPTRSERLLGEKGRVGGRVFLGATLRPLFHPRSVAVVGASRNPLNLGHRILGSLIRGEFDGPVYPVNLTASHVRSIRAYPSVAAIGAPVDLAVIAVPAPAVAGVGEECAAAGVRALVVISAGFAETGAEGRRRQEELLDRVRRHGMRMVGPNCLGVIHTHPEVRLNASFTPWMPPPGSVALCSQSGALGVAIIALARRLGLGLSAFVSVGNKADVSGNDLLEYWEEDPLTRVVLFYLESFGDPRRFARLARRVGRAKPIVVVKAGRTAAGSRAASSHTAALTAADTAVEALFGQTGVIRADTLEEMFGVARALVDQPLPPGRRVAVVTNAGGPAILCVDAAEGAGLRVEPLSEKLQAELRALVDPAASTRNPVDMIAAADPATYRSVVETVLRAEEVDALIVIYTPVHTYPTETFGGAVMEGVAAARRAGAGAGKPVYAALVGEEAEIYRLEEGAARGTEAPEAAAGRPERIPVYAFPEEMARVLGKVAAYAEWRRSDPGLFPEFPDQDLERAREACRTGLASRGAGWLAATEAREVLEAAGLGVAPGGLAATAKEAAEIAERLGYPVAVKLASTELVHKTEIGGVLLGLEDAAAVRRAFGEIADRLRAEGQEAAMQGVLVQPMLSGTAEVMIGVEQDPVFGPLVAFGLGGIHVEVLRDVAFRVSPLTDRDARAMVREIRGYRLLEGYRGYPAADVGALEEALLRISRLVEVVPEIREMDLNPIFALEPGAGYRIADARIRVEEAPVGDRGR